MGLKICDWLTQLNLEGKEGAVGVKSDKKLNRLNGQSNTGSVGRLMGSKAGALKKLKL